MNTLLRSAVTQYVNSVCEIKQSALRITLIQLFRYTLVGGLALIVDFGVLAFLTESLSVHYLLSAAISFMLGLTVNYGLSVFWVFDQHRLDNRLWEFAIFSTVGVFGLGFNEMSIWLFTERIKFHYLASKLLSTIFVFLWNFLARKFLLFG